MMIIAQSRRSARGCFGPNTMMKKTLLCGLIAAASEAIAQDAQCVPERVAMVENIRGYARSEADILGPRGISRRVLEAMGQMETRMHCVIPVRFVPHR